MRAFSSVVSVALHVGLGLAVLFGSARTGRSNPRAPDTISMVFPQPAPRTTTSGIWAPSGPPTVVNGRWHDSRAEFHAPNWCAGSCAVSGGSGAVLNGHGLWFRARLGGGGQRERPR